MGICMYVSVIVDESTASLQKLLIVRLFETLMM